MKLVGIEVQNFRSIGEPGVVINPMRKCNILVGQNNAGKSNVIRAIQKAAAMTRQTYAVNLTSEESNELSRTLVFETLDNHKRDVTIPFKFKLTFHANKTEEWEADLERWAGSDVFEFSFVSSEEHRQPQVMDSTFAHITDNRAATGVLEMVQQTAFGSLIQAIQIKQVMLGNASLMLNRWFAPYVPRVYLIPEFRRIEVGVGDQYELAGRDLISLLARYQHPELGDDNNRRKFDRIQEFVRRLLHLPEAQLEVTRQSQTIMLTHDGLRLPLSSYGTGVHQLVIMVTAVLSLDGAICCIEEPEIHLHPSLQREFIEFLATETNNTYLLSTHSPTFINAQTRMPHATREQIQVFHIQRESTATVGGPVLEDEGSLRALHDLGVKASDLLQANCVIWVEGPSDRVYLNRWIELIDPDLIEGLHYSIMSYGGKLLSHVSLVRETGSNTPLTVKVPHELVEGLRINQHAIVLIDSDRKASGGRINETKKRIRAECEASGGLCWITDGREIENYLPASVVIRACEAQTGAALQFQQASYENFEETLDAALKAARKKAWKYASDKVKYARLFARHFSQADIVPPLRNRVEEAVRRIAEWNA